MVLEQMHIYMQKEEKMRQRERIKRNQTHIPQKINSQLIIDFNVREACGFRQ